MTARNDITGDAIQTKGSNDAYREGWDRIFGRKEPPVQVPILPKPVADAVASMEALKQEQQAKADAERLQWWTWVQKHQRELTNIPSFQEWKSRYMSADEGNTPD